MNILRDIFSKKIINPHIPRYDKALYFRPGETFDVTGPIVATGLLTSGATIITAGVTLPKSLKYINKVTLEDYDITARNVPGGYSLNRDSKSNTSLSSTDTNIATENNIRIDLTKNDGFAGTNNTPVVLIFFTLKLRFD